ncbi:SDR family NAD(P)-dependent oxidoreductase [Actinomadura bangladeshensis]|uniref:SDR family NAD(P)-dependent oxidoreductase n=1 Tax=Actinomadura bangladeshensis TaxID=453573 RepID=A0A6L9QIL1_9ACTN|nr:SDR family NAD(P)-dependent oxidoreductase [Actinomadura bangladeshensis]NEA24942.1 SDR family NAD(P)-dependent oxidoreductase [Actinomadura bangladeshensis]
MPLPTNSSPAADLDAITARAAAVPGVREAATVADRTLRRRIEETAPVAPPPRPAPERTAQARPAIVAGPATRPPAAAVGTLPEALIRAAELAPERGTTFVHRDGSEHRQTYAQLLDDASRVLAGLREAGARPGEAIVLHCADNRAYVIGFWACLLGGFVPTPFAPQHQSDAAYVRRFHGVWSLLDQPMIMTDPGRRDALEETTGGWEGGRGARVAVVDDLMKHEPAEPAAIDPQAPAVNLLTSGSTGTPKVVRHAHASIVARTYATIAANAFTEHEVSLNWMPLDHVGGMVMFNVRDVLLRCEHVNAITDAFVRRPLTWLDWIERFHATNTWAPNFAFALVNKCHRQIEAGRWDLSSMTNICDAGEAIVPRTAHRFLELLGPHGLRPDAVVPCWGMSETSSGVTYARMDLRDPSAGTVSVERQSLSTGQVAVVPYGTPQSMVLADVGAPISGVELRVVDDRGAVVPERTIGHLHVRGATMLREYFRNPEANAASRTADGWFDTGDLGFLHDGRLTLTGRQKDVLIVNGANYPAHEMEAVVAEALGERVSLVAACGIQDENTGTDGAHVFFVPAGDAIGRVDAAVAGIRDVLGREFGIAPAAVVPVTAGEFPRTSTGKIQRGRLADAFRAGLFDDRKRVAPGGAPAADAWLFDSVFEPSQPITEARGRPVVVYAPSLRWFDDHLAERLSGTGSAVITMGAEAARLGPARFRIEPDEPEQHDRALAEIAETLGTDCRVVYAWPGDPAGAPDAPSAHLLTALAALARVLPAADLTVVTRGALAAGPDDAVDPAQTALIGLVRTADIEVTLPSVRLVDVPADASDADLADAGLAHFGASVVALRDGVASTPRLRRIEQAARMEVPASVLPRGGTALVIGGLGGIGRLIGEYLLVSADARLLVTGRTAAGDLAGTGADTVLAGLRELGDVRYAAADIADADALRSAVEEAERAWGRRLDLVVDLAGSSIAPQWHRLPEHELRRESVPWLRHMLHPKLAGCAALETLLETRPGTAVVLFSSVNGFLGGSSAGAYSAANAAMEGFAHRWSRQGRTVRCVGWSMWAGTGMNDGSPLATAAERRGFRAIEPSKGLELFTAALHAGRNWLLAGVDPANPHIKEHLAADQFDGAGLVVAVVPEETAEAAEVTGRVAAALAETGVFADLVALPALPRDAAGRPDAAAVLAMRDASPAAYAAPEGAAEISVAEVFAEVLGHDRIGRDDSFFGLGGDSIRATQAMSAVNERLLCEFPVHLLYVHSTVRELAAAVGHHA